MALSSFNEYAIVRRMLENGASGYVVKNAMPEEIKMSVEMAANNASFLCEEIDLLMRKRSKNPIWLTPREKELLKLIVDGFTNHEKDAIETIEELEKRIFAKFN